MIDRQNKPVTVPLVLAHRGASAIAPENTIAAFLLARTLGADGIELDVQLSRDRVPVVIHDNTVDRTTDGTGRVSSLSVVELKELDAGRWKSEEYSSERIPTLSEVFDALESWLEPGQRETPCIVNIELKGAGMRSAGLELAVVNLIHRRNLRDRIIISSFEPLALYRVRSLDPGIRRGLLYSSKQPVHLRRAWLRPLLAPTHLHPEHTLVDVALLEWARRKRYRTNTWTVDNPHQARRLAAIGVDGIITNKPDIIRSALKNNTLEGDSFEG